MKLTMKAITLVIIVLHFISNTSTAQSAAIQKIAAQVSTESLKKNLYYLASDKLEGRLMASHGNTLASLFIADWFKKCNLKPAYNNGKSYFQNVIAKKKNLVKSELQIDNKTFSEYDGWFHGTFDYANLKDLQIVFAGYGIIDSAYNDFENINVKGKAVVCISSRESRISTALTAKQSFRKIFETLQNNGAAALLIYQNNFKERAKQNKNTAGQLVYANSFNPNSVADLQLFAISNEMVNNLLYQNHTTIDELEDCINNTKHPQSFDLKTKINLNYQVELKNVIAPNVIGIIEGTNRSAECIIMSAHHDHEGKSGNVIYYGAVDNASGTVVIMEIAALMDKAIQKGFRPKRTIVFASFTGEERGLLGSQYYVANPIYPLNKTRAIYNIDMLGRVDTIHAGKIADSNYVYTIVKDSLNIGLRKALIKANLTVKLTLDGRFEEKGITTFLYSSDHAPFYKKGIPFLRTMCGMTKEYHEPADTPDKINYPLLTKQTELAFLTLWNIANE